MMTASSIVTGDVNGRRWASVLARDASQDGRFYYGVTSTGVFCRPSCPSRRPGRERVRFFATAAAAEQAGFRPCLRCRPLGASDPWLAKVAVACRAIADAGTTPLSLEQLARLAGSARHHFLRNFTRIVGVTPRAFAEARRFDAVKAALRSAADVTTAMYEAGYGSGSRFYERAAPKLGMSPSVYKAGGTGEVVRYTCAQTPIGRVLVAATPRGVCRVSVGSADADLVQALRAEFPRATVQRAPADLEAAVAAVLAHLAGRSPRLDLPLDVQATAFQWQVWNALREIPRGETRSYSAVAAAIGRPRAARAVARACATNPVALAIPCHRVVPSAGGVGGYRWGAERKKALLTREHAIRTPRR